jgi:hypothetical protein
VAESCEHWDYVKGGNYLDHSRVMSFSRLTMLHGLINSKSKIITNKMAVSTSL